MLATPLAILLSVLVRIMAINKINVSDLIANVRQNPILWDSRDDNYKMAELKPELWKKIAENVKAEKSGFFP